MRVNRSVAGFGAAAPVEKSIALTTFSDGRVEIHSDVPGARVEVTQDADSGAVTVAEVLPSGETGETVTISTSAPPAEAEMEPGSLRPLHG